MVTKDVGSEVEPQTLNHAALSHGTLACSKARPDGSGHIPVKENSHVSLSSLQLLAQCGPSTY